MALLPVAGARHIGQQGAALTHAGGRRGGEGDHGLASEVVVGHEVVDRPCGDAPPDGVADEHGVVAAPVRHGGGGQGHVPQGFIVVLTTDAAVGIRPVQVVAGIYLRGDDLKEVCARGGSDVLGHPRGVAAGGVIDHQRLAGLRLLRRGIRLGIRVIGGLGIVRSIGVVGLFNRGNSGRLGVIFRCVRRGVGRIAAGSEAENHRKAQK